MFSRSLALLRSQMSDKRLFRRLDKLLLPPRWCSERSKRPVHLAHSKKVVVYSKKPPPPPPPLLSFRKLLCRSTVPWCGAFDKRCGSFGKSRHLLVEAVEEHLAVLLCSHKLLLVRWNLVVHKLPSNRLNMALEQLVAVLEFVAEHNVPQQA